jgi:RIO-like serine/threonine protein kinase
MIKDETNLTIELENLKKFSATYKDSGVLFPKPFEEFCSNSAIVMSFMDGFRFDDKTSLEKYDIDFKQIISKLVNFYTEQMLINGYFHADPHPGNLLVNANGELILLDFGMVKNIPNDSRVAIICLKSISYFSKEVLSSNLKPSIKLITIALFEQNSSKGFGNKTPLSLYVAENFFKFSSSIVRFVSSFIIDENSFITASIEFFV